MTQAGPFGFKDTPPAQGAAAGIRGKQTMTVFALEVFGAFLVERTEEILIQFDRRQPRPVASLSLIPMSTH